MIRIDEPLSHQTILVVEDGVCIAFAIESFLLEAGARNVSIATTLREAEALVGTHSFDAAVLDIRLPDGETYDLITFLQHAGTPVVIYSGHVDDGHLSMLAPVVVCAKPAMPSELIQSILDASDLKPSQKALPDTKIPLGA